VDLITNHAINAFFAPITGTPSEKERVLEALGRKLLEILISLTILSKKLMYARFIRTWEVNLDVVIRASEEWDAKTVQYIRPQDAYMPRHLYQDFQCDVQMYRCDIQTY